MPGAPMRRTQAYSRGSRYYSTTFALTENPISEGGAWHASGLGLILSDIGQPALPAASTPVITSGGKAYGVSSTVSASGYDDSRALLSGFPANHSAAATLAVTTPTGTYSEVELHLRFDDSGTYAGGYEILLSAYHQYQGVVRWNRDGTFTELYQYGNTFPTPANGDVYFAQIVGNLITCKMNGTTLYVYDVTSALGAALPFTTGIANSNGDGGALVFATGQPGMGFDTNGDDSAFAFGDYTAVGL